MVHLPTSQRCQQHLYPTLRRPAHKATTTTTILAHATADLHPCKRLPLRRKHTAWLRQSLKPIQDEQNANAGTWPKRVGFTESRAWPRRNISAFLSFFMAITFPLDFSRHNRTCTLHLLVNNVLRHSCSNSTSCGPTSYIGTVHLCWLSFNISHQCFRQLGAHAHMQIQLRVPHAQPPSANARLQSVMFAAEQPPQVCSYPGLTQQHRHK